jgi:hypothetical protein
MQHDPSKFSGGEYLFEDVLEADLSGWLVGNPGISKTMVALDMAAGLTLGLLPGDFVDEPINVLYVSIENRFNRSVGPRFAAAQGDFTRFFHHDAVIALPSEVAKLKKLIRQRKARLCIIDPAKDHFDHGVYSSPSKSADFLVQIDALSAETHCSILCVDWPSKSAKKGDLSNSGNQSFTGKPRQIIQVGRLSLEEWVIGTSKVSEGAPFTGWIYTMDPYDLGINDAKTGRPIVPRRIRWLRPAKASEVMRAREQITLDENPHLDDLLAFMAPSGDNTAEEFVTKELLSWAKNVKGIGEKKARELLRACAAAGFITQIADRTPEKTFDVRYRIADVGTLRLAPDEESVEAIMEKKFPSRDRKPLPGQPALPPGPPQQGA